MPRPGFVLETDERTPRLLTVSGAELRLQRFGLGTDVVYPPDAEASTNPVALIEGALTSPVGAPNLSESLAGKKRLTIVVSDDQEPEPRMRFDVRRTVVERVLERVAQAGVDDVEIVIASGLNKRWTAPEMAAVLGDRVASSFLPEGLISSHDVTAENLVSIGEVAGHQVHINRRVAESDLVIVVGVTTGVDAACCLTRSMTDVATINRASGLDADSDFMSQSATLICNQLPIYCVRAVLGQPLLGRNLAFMHKREWEWRLPDQLSFAGNRQLIAVSPSAVANRIFARPQADYAVSDVVGGNPKIVSQEAAEVWRAANTVAVPRQADALVVSAWGASFDRGDPVGSPINAAHNALVTQAGCHDTTPLLRDGGVLLAWHPLLRNFSNRTQAADADLFATVLADTLDPTEIRDRYEAEAVSDPWYVRLYRERFASHPLRAFHRWYQVAAAAKRLSDVIWITGDRHSAGLLGHRTASSYGDALEIAADTIGRHPDITYLRGPGRAYGVVS